MTVELKSTLDLSTSYVIHLCITTVSVLNDCIVFCQRILTHHRFPANLSNQEASSKFSIYLILCTLSSPTCTVKYTAISYDAPIHKSGSIRFVSHRRDGHQTASHYQPPQPPSGYFENVHRDKVRRHGDLFLVDDQGFTL